MSWLVHGIFPLRTLPPICQQNAVTQLFAASKHEIEKKVNLSIKTHNFFIFALHFKLAHKSAITINQ